MSYSHLKLLLNDLEHIRNECLDQNSSKTPTKKSSSSGFFSIKEDITLLLDEISKQIKERNELFHQYGRTRTVISLNLSISKNIDLAKEKYNLLEKQLQKDSTRLIGRISPEEFQQRKEMCSIVQQLILDIQPLQTPIISLKNNRIASEAKQEMDNQSSSPHISIELSSLSPEENHFLEQIQQKDQIIDTKLNSVLQGIIILKEISLHIQEEVQVQNQIITETDQQVSKITNQFTSANQKMKLLLETTGGATRWCPIFVIIILLISLLGYILYLLQ
jgi:hypothetical protein